MLSLAACGSDDNSAYSDDYKTDSEYQQNCNDVAKAYGFTPEEVDRKIQAVAGD